MIPYQEQRVYYGIISKELSKNKYFKKLREPLRVLREPLRYYYTELHGVTRRTRRVPQSTAETEFVIFIY